MPLRIKLPSKDKVIINGAVIENSGEATTLVIHNRVDLLRRKEVMSEEQSNTPASRVYYALQCAYLFEDAREDYLKSFKLLLEDYLLAAPSAGKLTEEILGCLEREEYYTALRTTQKLLIHELERLTQVGLQSSSVSSFIVSAGLNKNSATNKKPAKMPPK